MTDSPFAQYMARADAEIDLAEAALLIAADVYPGLDVARYLQWLDTQAQVAHTRIDPDHNPQQIVGALNRLMFDELGFRGNMENYHDPRNSYLNEVIDRRTGIPITLCLLYMQIGARAGAHVEGVGLPGHFIARVRGEPWEMLVDPFNRGIELSRYDCEQLLEQLFGRPTPLLPQYLEPVGKRPFLIRMLTNLQVIYLQNEEWQNALAVIEKILQVQPDPPTFSETIRTRGLVHYKLGRWAAAEEDWLHYLTLASDAQDAPLIRQNIEAVRNRMARRN